MPSISQLYQHLNPHKVITAHLRGKGAHTPTTLLVNLISFYKTHPHLLARFRQLHRRQAATVCFQMLFYSGSTVNLKRHGELLSSARLGPFSTFSEHTSSPESRVGLRTPPLMGAIKSENVWNSPLADIFVSPRPYAHEYKRSGFHFMKWKRPLDSSTRAVIFSYICIILPKSIFRFKK